MVEGARVDFKGYETPSNLSSSIRWFVKHKLKKKILELSSDLNHLKKNPDLYDLFITTISENTKELDNLSKNAKEETEQTPSFPEGFKTQSVSKASWRWGGDLNPCRSALQADS